MASKNFSGAPPPGPRYILRSLNLASRQVYQEMTEDAETFTPSNKIYAMIKEVRKFISAQMEDLVGICSGKRPDLCVQVQHSGNDIISRNRSQIQEQIKLFWSAMLSISQENMNCYLRFTI